MPIIDMANPDAMTMVEEYIKNMQPKAFEVCFTQIDQALQNVLDRIQNLEAKCGSTLFGPLFAPV